MKKVLLITVLVLTMILSCSCVEEITDESIPGLGPMASATSPDAPDPVPNLDPDDIPDTTDPTDPGENGGENGGDTPVVIDDIVLDNGAGADNKAVTTAISGYIRNDNSSADGDIVNKYTSGTTTVYSVPYVRTLTFVVEVTTVGNNVKVDAYLEHYRMSMGNEKQIKVSIGDYSGIVTTAELEWEDNTSARTLLMSATAPKGDADSIKIDIDMPFGGTYHKEKIETLSLSVDHKLN